MRRNTRSEQSRRQVLDAALDLFSHQGYRATTMRDIAEKAGVSTGNVYHHFEEKEQIFRDLLDEFWSINESKRYPFTRALATGNFPDNLEQLGLAARDSVREFRSYIALIYVDVIEFDGTHIREFYKGLTKRLVDLVDDHPGIQPRLRENVTASSAMHMVGRLFINYFQLEILFGVSEPFGKESRQIVAEMADMLRCGIAREK